MQHLREAIEERLRDPPPFPEERFAGRGIVICAGGQRYFTCAWVLISILRRVHQTKLPIQVWHLGRNEMSEAMQLLLEERGRRSCQCGDGPASLSGHDCRRLAAQALRDRA